MLAEIGVQTVDLDLEPARAYDRLNQTLAEIADTDPSSLPLLRQQILRDKEIGLHPLLFYTLISGVCEDLSQSVTNSQRIGQILRSSALFHDMGKYVVSPVSVKDSIRVMSWVPETGSSGMQEDQRNTYIKETQRKHPYLSGLIAMPLLLSNQRMSQMDGARALEIVVNHHSNRVGGELRTGRGTPLESYPADPYVPSTEEVAWIRLLFELGDVTLGMAEPRGYRNGNSLNSSTISEELFNRTPPSRMEKYHRNGFSPELIGGVVIPSLVRRTEVLKPTIELMHVLDTTKLKWPDKPLTDEDRILDDIHTKLWGHYSGRPQKLTGF